MIGGRSCTFVLWQHLRGITNRSISKSAKYSHQTPDGQREAHELLSQKFHLKYILGIMNSSFASEWLKQKRRSKTDIYPDDWKQLPIPLIPREKQQKIVQLVDAILAEFKTHGYPLPTDAADRVAQLEAEIDKQVAQLYSSESEDTEK